MAAPTYAWVTIAATDYDPDSPVTAALFTAIIHDLIHVRETVYDPAIHVPAIAHNHDGLNSALIALPGQHNLISDWNPRQGPESDNVRVWQLSGWGTSASGLDSSGLNSYMTHILGDYTRESASKTLFGAGGNLLLACYLKLSGTATAGKVKIGLSDGHSSTFIGKSAEFDYVDMTTSYKRFYTKLAAADGAGSGHSTGVRMMVKITEAFVSATINANILECLPGTVLSGPPAPGYNTDRHHNWELLGLGGEPVYDSAIYENPIFREAA